MNYQLHIPTATPVEFRVFAPNALEKRAGDELPNIVGHAAVFNKLSVPLFGFREKIAPGAFTETLKEADVRALVDHDSSMLLARRVPNRNDGHKNTLALREDKVGLRNVIKPASTTHGHNTITLMKRGDLSGQSFAFRVITDRWEIKNKENIRTVEKVDLVDVSVVTFPAFPDAKAQIRALYEKSDFYNPDFEIRALMAAASMDQDAILPSLVRAEHRIPLFGDDRIVIRSALRKLEDVIRGQFTEERAQTVIHAEAEKEKWTKAEFRDWLEDHDMNSELEPDDTKEEWWVSSPEFPSSECDDDSFEFLTDDMPDGIRLLSCDRDSSSRGQPATPAPPARMNVIPLLRYWEHRKKVLTSRIG